MPPGAFQQQLLNQQGFPLNAYSQQNSLGGSNGVNQQPSQSMLPQVRQLNYMNGGGYGNNH